MPAKNQKNSKRSGTTKNRVKRIIRKSRPNAARVSVGALRRLLPASVTNYFDFLDGKGTDPVSTIPARQSRMACPFTAMYRFTVNTTANQSAQVLVNTHYTPDGTVVKLPQSLAAQYAAVSSGSLGDAVVINPYAFDGTSTMTSFHLPLVPTYMTENGIGTYGNMPGLQRIRGLRLTIMPRGTQLNAGGEVFVLHSPLTNNVAGSTSEDIFTHPDTRRFSIGQNKPIHYTAGPLRKRHEFIEIREFANMQNSAYPAATTGGDVDVFGDAHTASGGSTHYASDGYKGWDLGVVIKSAVASQVYEVQLQVFFDLMRTRPSAELTGVQSGFPIVTPSMCVPANQHLVDLMDTAHASQVLTRVSAMGSPAQSYSIWPHVEAAAKAVLPHVLEAGLGFLAGAT